MIILLADSLQVEVSLITDKTCPDTSWFQLIWG